MKIADQLQAVIGEVIGLKVIGVRTMVVSELKPEIVFLVGFENPYIKDQNVTITQEDYDKAEMKLFPENNVSR